MPQIEIKDKGAFIVVALLRCVLNRIGKLVPFMEMALTVLPKDSPEFDGLRFIMADVLAGLQKLKPQLEAINLVKEDRALVLDLTT